MANKNSRQSPPLQDEVLNQMRIGIENPLDPDISEPELSPFLVAGDHRSDNFLKLFHRVEVEVVEEWADVKSCKMGGLGFSVEEPEVTSNFCVFLQLMNGKVCEKPIIRYTTMILEQLKATKTSQCKLTK